MSRALTVEAATALRDAVTRHDAGAATRARRQLRHCTRLAIGEGRALLAYHDVLLFVCAYPASRELHAMASAELRRVASAAREQVARGGPPARALDGAGVAWSAVTRRFSLGLARWLAQRHPAHAEIDGFAEGGLALAAVLQLSMPAIEDAAVADADGDPQDALAALAEGWRGSRLAWLVGELARVPCVESVRELLWESLRPWVSIRPGGGPLSRTFARGLGRVPFVFDQGLVRRADPAGVIGEPLPRRRRLSTPQRERLVDTARAALAVLGRETDPVTLCTPQGVAAFDLGRGATIALYSMAPARRSPLDAHLGFVLFRNALPVAYGGGWPFLALCRIGVNIFEPYRGGESAWVFCQVLRVYARLCGARRFLVEPYQFGAGNPEGLRSGAFWFYYRLGFRPVAPRLAALAAEEFARVSDGRGYRSPLPVLRRLATSDVELVLPGGEGAQARCEPASLSAAVTAWIAREHNGDRGAALAAARSRVDRALGVSARERSRWPEGEQAAYEALSPLMALVPDLAGWPDAQRRRTVALMRARGAEDGLAWFACVAGHRRWRETMADLGGRPR